METPFLKDVIAFLDKSREPYFRKVGVKIPLFSPLGYATVYVLVCADIWRQSDEWNKVLLVMHLSSAFPGWGTPGIPGGIATFYIKTTQFSEPSGMI